jgi:hypothetical protein
MPCHCAVAWDAQSNCVDFAGVQSMPADAAFGQPCDCADAADTI